MLILSVETSCDETSVAVTKNGKKVLSNAVRSQMNIHEKFGGVVPEVASRAHLESMLYMFDEALKKAQVTPQEIDAVAVTQGPGLIGSLLVGISAATSFAYAHQKPLLGVNHLIGHIYASQIVGDFKFPSLTLLVSGGHTELLLLKNHFEIELIGVTLDDAVGEAYDKVARLLGLAYPGGPIVDKLAQAGKDIYHLPRPMLKDASFHFSFSGLKSAIAYLVKDLKEQKIPFKVEDMCASFQAAVTDVLIEKTYAAKEALGVKQIILAGGVAANQSLRKKMKEKIQDVDILIPPIEYCTDQAAMIGLAAYYQYQKFGAMKDYLLKGHPSLPIDHLKQF